MHYKNYIVEFSKREFDNKGNEKIKDLGQIEMILNSELEKERIGYAFRRANPDQQDANIIKFIEV